MGFPNPKQKEHAVIFQKKKRESVLSILVLREPKIYRQCITVMLPKRSCHCQCPNAAHYLNLYVNPPYQRLPLREKLESFILQLFQTITRFTLKSARVPCLKPIIALCLTGWHCVPISINCSEVKKPVLIAFQC